MGVLIHVLQFNDEDCTTHVIMLEQIGCAKCRYPVPKIQNGSGKGKFASLDIFLTTGTKLGLYLNGKTVFRIIDDDGPVFETVHLKEFEKSLIELIRGNGVYQPAISPPTA